MDGQEKLARRRGSGQDSILSFGSGSGSEGRRRVKKLLVRSRSRGKSSRLHEEDVEELSQATPSSAGPSNPSPTPSPATTSSSAGAPPVPIIRPPSPPRRMSSANSDFDRIGASDAESFEDDGREGSLQDALEGLDEHQRAEHVPEAHGRRSHGRRRRHKEARPGKQHGAGYLPSSSASSQPRGHRARRSLDLQIPRIERRAASNADPSPSPASGISGRLGGWISQAFSASASHLPLSPPEDTPRSASASFFRRSPEPPPLGRRKSRDLLSSPASSSSSQKRPSPQPRALGNLLDKAVNYLFDTDAHAYDTRLTDDIWMMGGQKFDGVWAWEPPSSVEARQERAASTGTGSASEGGSGRRRVPRRATKTRHLFRHKRGGSTDSRSDGWQASPSPSPSSEAPVSAVESLPADLTHCYPPPFYVAFASILGLTYRSDFPPIPCSPDRLRGNGLTRMIDSISMSIGRASRRGELLPPRLPTPAEVANLAAGLTLNDGLTTDAGWGCMLRTGQSLLANALLYAHLGRDWRRPLASVADPQHDGSIDPTYARIVSWFIDSPSPLAPFSVHHFAAKGKELGKEIGEWFGPSTAAGAIKSLANGFGPAGLGVVTDVDGSVYSSEVLAASRWSSGSGSAAYWQRPVLVLGNIRLGIDGVHPSYYDSVKALFRLPQSVGISGGRPSSSYYFFATQGDSLFYIDPHHPQPAIALIDVPPVVSDSAAHRPLGEGDWEDVSRGALDAFFANAYPDSALRTFHNDRIRRMAITGMDPSMLVGFLVRDGDDWDDFCSRLAGLKLLHVAESTPAWMQPSEPSPSVDSDLGVDSMSDASGHSSRERERWPSAEPEEVEPVDEERARNVSGATVRAEHVS